MSFPLRIAVVFIFALFQLVAGEDVCIFCNRRTENDFLDCVSKKILWNRELNIPPDLVDTLVKSLKAASRAIRTSDSVKAEILKGALAGEIMGMIESVKSSGTNKNAVGASIMRSIDECYTAVTGQSGTKFSNSIGRLVTNMLLDEVEASQSNAYSQPPEPGFGSSNDYPNPPPVIENSPSPFPPNQEFPVIQPQQNVGPSQQIPFQPLPPSVESVATSSFPQNHEFAPNARRNAGNRAPFQQFPAQDFSSPVSYDSASAVSPQNGANYVPFPGQNFPASDSYPSPSVNAPQNRDTYASNAPQIGVNYVPYQSQDFPPVGSFASSNANVPQNGDNYVPSQSQDFSPSGSFANVPQNGNNYAPRKMQYSPPSGSSASSSANVPQNGNNNAPFKRQYFPPSESSSANSPQNGYNFGPIRRRNPPVSDSYASANSNVGPNGNNFTPFQKPDLVAPASTNAGQNADNYAPNNNDQQFLGKNSRLVPISPVIPPNPLQSAPITPESNQPPFALLSDSLGPYNSNRVYSNGQFVNPPILSPVEPNINRSPPGSNAGSSSQTSFGRNNNGFQNYPNYADANVYKGGNNGPNEYYNDYGNNRGVPNGQPTSDLISQDYYPINSQASGINSDGNQPQRTQDFPGSFPLQPNVSPNYQPLNGQPEYQNPVNQFIALSSFAVANSDDGGSGIGFPQSSEGAFPLQQAPNQGYIDQPNGPSSIEVPQIDDTGFGRSQPTSSRATSDPAQNFNEGPQTTPNRQVNIPTNDDLVPQNNLNSEDTATETTTVSTTQVPTTQSTTKAPKQNINATKSCAMEFAEATFVHLTEDDSFNCAFNEDTPHDEAVSIAGDAIKNAFRNAGLKNYANQAKRYCVRQVSQLPSGATSQKYAEKISKSVMMVLYKNDLLDTNCKDAGKFIGEQILNAVSDITGLSDADDNEKDKEPSENGNENPSQSKKPASSSSAVAAAGSNEGYPDNYNGPPPQNSDNGSPDYNNSPQSSNAPSSSSAAAAAGSIDGSPDNYNGPQPNNVQDTGSAGALAASQAPVNRYPPRRQIYKSRRIGRRPGNSDNNTPNDSSSGASSNSETPVSAQNSDNGSPDYYNPPQSNNAPSSSSAAAAAGSNGGFPHYYNGPQPQNSDNGGPDYYNYPQSNNSPSSSATAAASGSNGGSPDYYNGPQPQNSDNGSPDYYNSPSAAAAAADSNVGSPDNYNGPQPNNAQDTGALGPMAASQAPGNKNPLSRFPKRSWNKNRRGRRPGFSDNNAPDDASSGASSNSETPQNSGNGYPDYYNSPQANNAPSSSSAAAVAGSNEGSPDYYNGPPPQNSNNGSPDYYNSPQSNNQPSSSAAAAASDSNDGSPDNYNGPPPNNAQDTRSAGPLAASQAPSNKNSLSRFPKRSFNKNRRGRRPGNSDNNEPDDASSGASSNSETPVSPQNSDNGSPAYNNSPRPNNAPSSSSAAAAAGSNEGSPDYYNGPQPQNSDNGSPDYYNSPQSNNQPSSSAAASAANFNEGSPNNYNGPQQNNAQDAGSAGSLAASQASVNKNPLSRFPNRSFNKNRRGRRPGNSDNIESDDASSGASSNSETPVSPQNADNGNPNYNNSPQSNNAPSSSSAVAAAAAGSNEGSPDYYNGPQPQNSDNGSPDNYNSPQSNNAPSSSSAAAVAGSQDSNGGNPNDDDNDASNTPVESNPDNSGSSNPKENELLNELKDPDSKNHIEHLMKTAIDCVSPDGFNYKSFTLELASVATEMKKEHPDKSPEEILDKTYITAMVALTRDLQNAMFNQQGNNVPQSSKDSQPPPATNSDSNGYEPTTNYQGSGSSAVAVANSQSAPTDYQNVRNYQNTFPQPQPNLYRSNGYEPTTNYQESGSSAVAVANSQTAPTGYQNVGNYQNTFPQPQPNVYRSNSDSNGYEPSNNFQDSGSSASAVANSQTAPIGYQNEGNFQNTFQAEPFYGNPLQTNMNPSLQNVGQNNWGVSNGGNNLLNVGRRGPPQNFDYNRNRDFGYAAAV